MQPFFLAPRPSADALELVRSRAEVPLWLPDPMPVGWVVSGVGHAGDERTGARATLLACSGPAPLGGPADLVLVAEEPAVGLGARFSGLSAADPGPEIGTGPPAGKLTAAGHLTPLWSVHSPPNRAAFAGEALALWLWVVLWPANAALLLLEDLELSDLREGQLAELVTLGAPSPRLAEPPAGEAAAP